MQINSTMVAGVAAGLGAAVATGAASVRARRRRVDRPGEWLALAALHALLAVEVAAGGRFRLHDAARALFDADAGSERRPFQVLMLVVLAVAGTLLVARLVRGAPTRRLALARSAAAALVGLFLIETVSLHQVDALFYLEAGTVKLIGWLWLACAAATIGAALSPPRRDRTAARPG